MFLKSKALIASSIALALLLVTSLTSCKKCTFGEDTVGGIVLEDVSVFPLSGYMTGNMGSDYHIDSSHNLASYYEISSDAGITRTAVDYNTYSILANPAIVPCEAAFDRTVTIDSINMLITYDLTIKVCKDSKCAETRSVENYVAVPAFSSANYSVTYNQIVVEQ